MAADRLEDVAVVADGAGDEWAGLFEGAADGFATRDFADDDAAVAIVDDGKVAGEVGGVCAAEIQQHAVVAGDGDDFDGADFGGAGEAGCGHAPV